MRLARKNDDPVLLRDLERLSGRGGPVDVLERAADDPSSSAASAPAARTEDLEKAKEALAAFKRPPLPPEVEALGPFEQRFVRGVVHVRRFLPFYAGAAVWLFAMLLIQPLGGGDGPGSADLAGAVSRPSGAVASSAAVPAAATEVVDAAPVFDDFGGSTFSSTGSSFLRADEGFDDDADLASTAPSAPPAAPAFDDAPIDFGDDGDDAEAEPTLSVTSSGYASATGGTPLEQMPPADALPVHVVAGQAQKISYLKLAGDDTTLRLRLAEGGVNAEGAVVRACVATADWPATRGAPLSAAPPFDAARCATGRPGAAGVVDFDLAGFGVAGDGFGYVLTGGDATPPPSFQIAFEPVAVPAPSSGEG